MEVIYAINVLEEITSEGWTILYDKISDSRKEKVERYRFYLDKKRSLLAETLVRYAFMYDFGIKSEEIKFVYNEFGKPLVDGREDLFFNISHSGDWVVCSVANIPVGIDVEFIDKVNENIYEKVLTHKEYEYLLTCKEYAKKEFYKIWTLKESYVKALGIGMGLPFDKIEFIHESNGVIRAVYSEKKDLEYSFYSTNLDENHMLAICARTNEEIKPMFNINYLNIDKLIRSSKSK